MLAVGAVVAAACGSGRSALQAGLDEPDTVASTAPPSTVQSGSPGGSTPTDSTGSTSDTTPATIAPTTTESPLADQPGCPTGALDDASGPVEITFWHGMANELETSLIALTDEYNASQDRVHVDLQNQTSYNSAIDKYIQSSQDSRPTMIQFPEYVVQSFAQSGTLIPIEACLRGQRLRHVGVPRAHARRLHVRGHPLVDAVQREQPGAVLQPPDVRGGRPRSGRVARVARRPPRHVADHRRQRRGELTAGSSIRARTRAAAGSSSSGSVGPTSCTPTTATAVSRRRPRCSTTARPASTCSRSCSR